MLRLSSPSRLFLLCSPSIVAIKNTAPSPSCSASVNLLRVSVHLDLGLFFSVILFLLIEKPSYSHLLEPNKAARRPLFIHCCCHSLFPKKCQRPRLRFPSTRPGTNTHRLPRAHSYQSNTRPHKLRASRCLALLPLVTGFQLLFKQCRLDSHGLCSTPPSTLSRSVLETQTFCPHDSRLVAQSLPTSFSNLYILLFLSNYSTLLPTLRLRRRFTITKHK